MELLPVIALALLAAGGAAVGVIVALRSGTSDSRAGGAAADQQEGYLRVTAQIHTGWEQTLVGLVRELRLPRATDGVAYGALYLEPRTEHRMFIRTRSEIGRGFLGAVDIIARRGPTEVTYAILRLPGDELLHARVLDFELQLISALRRIDPDASVRLAADALREIDRPRSST